MIKEPVHRPLSAVCLLALSLAVAASGPRTARAASDTDSLYGDAEYEETEAAGFWDPCESFNRKVFATNLKVDPWVVKPVVHAYDTIAPESVQRAVVRVLTNLDSPSVFVNDLLQLDPIGGTVTVTRFAINTTIGLLGIFDPATAMGIKGHDTDFGQTMAFAGIPSGPYVVLFLIGPTNTRDGFGYVVDFFFRPTTYILTPAAQVLFTGVREGSTGIAKREEQEEALRQLELSSVDFYAALRNAYYQNRTGQIEARRRGRSENYAVVRRFFTGGSGGGELATPGGEVGDPGTDGGEQRAESVARDQ
jgi:phospholipid-binding lipoprotein MlaA